jgi:uncharacterized phosphosugar-binding protein
VLHPAQYESAGDNLTEEVSDLVLTSGIPFTNGVLYVPEIPAVRFAPMSVQGCGNFFWMVMGEIAAREKGGASNGSTDVAEQYINLVMQRGEKIKGDFDHIDETGKMLAQYVADGAAVWTYSGGGTGMSGEINHRASGLAMIKGLNPDKVDEDVKSGDICFLASEVSDEPETYQMAEKLNSMGVHTIYTGPAETVGSNGNDVAKIAEMHIETYSPEREGVIQINGWDRMLLPATGIMYAFALWMTNSQFLTHLINQDMTPYLWMGIHLIGGRGYNDEMRELLASRGY